MLRIVGQPFVLKAGAAVIIVNGYDPTPRTQGVTLARGTDGMLRNTRDSSRFSEA
jgi:hypothetical protein